MHKRHLGILPALLLLTACGATPKQSDDLRTLLENPLYAERYYERMTSHLVDLVIANDPLTTEGETRELIDDLREHALEEATAANALQAKGWLGGIVSNRDLSGGEALLLDGTLYFGPSFFVEPGPNLQIYLTMAKDPEAVTFPDETAVNIGQIHSFMGAQQFSAPLPAVQEGEESLPWQTMVLWDDTFKRVYGFAQLRR